MTARSSSPPPAHAGIPELTFHDLRHTGASLMIAAGCHVKVIAEQMGHADGGALVLRRYGHLYKGARRAGRNRTGIARFRGSAILLLGWMLDETHMGLDLPSPRRQKPRFPGLS